MATTDARTGFRLPWSSDQRSPSDDGASAPADMPAGEAGAVTPGDAPVNAAVDSVTGQATDWKDEMTPTAAAATHETAVPESTPAAPSPHKRPNKFLADLTRAMQAAAESARDEAMGRIQADAKSHIEAIHERSATDAADLRRKADDDVAAIREWSKTEIARIREETDQRISARKGNLEFEIEEHAARIERQIEHVQGRVGAFETEMASFFERLLSEEDPTRFASLAENLPEPPPFDLDELAASAWLDTQSAGSEPHVATVETTIPAHEATAGDETDSQAMAALEAPAEALAPADDNEAEAVSVAEPAESAETATEDGTDPRLSALSMSADFEAAEAEAFEAAGSTAESEEIPTISDDDIAARLAGLVPDQDAAGPTDHQTTQVVVSGLVSVASIASFKRHLGRLPGVQSVGVSSGPEGEFVFAVSHGPDVVLRDSVPSLPGFNARITGGDGQTVEVTAQDPESEG
jgi:hypothetical protein